MGEISRTLNLLVGGVSDLVGAADETSGRLARVVEEGRAGLEVLAVDAQRVRQLADEVLARARQAMAAARPPGGRTRAGEPAPGPQAAGTGSARAARTPAHGSPPARLEDIVGVVSELAEQVRVLAVGVSLQAAATDAPAVLRSIGDDVELLAEHAERAVGRLGPLVQAALEQGGGAAQAQPAAASDRVAGGSPAALRIAEQMTAVAELATGLRASAERLARAQEEIAAPLGGLAELANRLRRATGRFRLPD
jgi:methyl-accepting chemotaxis protein